MFCTTCGSVIPAHSSKCPTCGSVAVNLSRYSHSQENALLNVAECPTCRYVGEGIPFFSKGMHVFTLVMLTLFTGWAMGAGGLAFFLFRREHKICPRCGRSWGPQGTLARQGGYGSPPTLLSRESADIARRARVAGLLAVLCLVLGLAMGSFFLLGGALLSGVTAGYLRSSLGNKSSDRLSAVQEQRQLAVLRHAHREGGVLTVTGTAAALGWPINETEEILQSLDDGIRIDSRVTDEGIIVYHFLELQHTAPRRSELAKKEVEEEKSKFEMRSIRPAPPEQIPPPN